MAPTEHALSQARPATREDTGFSWLAVLLLMAIHLSLAWSLDAAGWAEGLNVAPWAAVGGVLVGGFLARTTWPTWFIRVYALVTGLAVSLYLGSTLLPETYTGQERSVAVVVRLVEWAQQALRGETTGDNLVFVLDVVLLLWWSGIYTARSLLRHGHVWRAVVPPGIVLTINAYYAFTDLRPYLLLYLAATVVLLVVTHLYTLMARWELERVRYPMDIGMDFLRNGALFGLAVLVIAWMLPPLASAQEVARWLDPARGTWRRVQEGWGRLFNTLNYQAAGVIPTFQQSFTLTGGPNLSERPYFAIEAPKGRYWRAAVYDRYRGDGWDNTVGEGRALAAQETIVPPALREVELITQTVKVLMPGALSLVAAPMPIQFNIPVDGTVVNYPDAVGGGGEVLFAYAQTVLEEGSTYTVISLVPNPSAWSLRRAPTKYPPWIVDRYLQLPANLPQRVRELAAKVTAGLDNPYDKAKAIEAYLRDIPYNDQIPAPPPGRDAVDWFLFDFRQGYCDYYASAMVVMARSVGIPARLASGYARGEFDSKRGIWIVRERDAHSWPELYFPGYGWVPFEPTPAQPPLVRPERSPTTAEEMEGLEQWLNSSPDREQNIPEDVEVLGQPVLNLGPLAWRVPASLIPFVGFAQTVPWPVLGVPLMLVGVGWLGVQTARRRMNALAHRPDVAVVLYTRLVQWGRRLGLPLRAWQTPTEHAGILERHLPEHRTQVWNIVRAYEHTVYAPPTLRLQPTDEATRLVKMWQRLWPTLVQRWLHRRLHIGKSR